MSTRYRRPNRLASLSLNASENNQSSPSRLRQCEKFADCSSSGTRRRSIVQNLFESATTRTFSARVSRCRLNGIPDAGRSSAQGVRKPVACRSDRVFAALRAKPRPHLPERTPETVPVDSAHRTPTIPARFWIRTLNSAVCSAGWRTCTKPQSIGLPALPNRQGRYLSGEAGKRRSRNCFTSGVALIRCGCSPAEGQASRHRLVSPALPTTRP